MTYRVLVDENTSPQVAGALRERGHEAVHVTEALAPGVSDGRIVEYARTRDLAVLTHDVDFLHSEHRGLVPVLYYSDDDLDSSEIVARVEHLVRYVPEPGDLPPVTNLSRWE